MDDHKLFVGNMAARITQRDLWRFFSPYGLIDECAKFHESYAFVRFVSANDAQRARRETHGALLKGRKLKVEFAATMNKSNPALGHPPSNLFTASCGNLYFLLRRIRLCPTVTTNGKSPSLYLALEIIDMAWRSEHVRVRIFLWWILDQRRIPFA